MKFAFLFALLFISSGLIAQETTYDKKTNEVSVDGTHAFNIVRTCDHGSNCRFDVFDLAGKKVIRINYLDFNSPVEVSKANPNGTVRYLQFIFLETQEKAEYDSSVINPKRAAELVAKNQLIQNGELNDAAKDEFILVNGNRFSERIRF